MATSSVQHDVSIRVTSHSRRRRRVSGQASIKSPPISESRTPRQGRAIGYPRTKASTGSSQGYEPDDEASCVASVEKVRSWQERLSRPKGGKGCIGEQERANENADLPQGLQQGTNPRPSSVRNSTAAVTRIEYPQIETRSRAEDVRPPSIFPCTDEAAFTGEIARTSQPQERAAANNQSTSSTHRSSQVGKPKSARNSTGDCRIILPPSPYEREVVVYHTLRPDRPVHHHHLSAVPKLPKGQYMSYRPLGHDHIPSRIPTVPPTVQRPRVGQSHSQMIPAGTIPFGDRLLQSIRHRPQSLFCPVTDVKLAMQDQSQYSHGIPYEGR